MTCTDHVHKCEALSLGFFALMGEVPQSFDMTRAAVERCNARRAAEKHSDGTFKARPARVAAPLLIASAKSERVAKGNRTRWAAYRKRVAEVAAMLRDEARGEMVAF